MYGLQNDKRELQLSTIAALDRCLGIIVFAMEYPLLGRNYFLSSSSHMPKVLLYIPLTMAAFLESQTVNGGLYLAIGTMAYLTAVRKEFLKVQARSTPV